MVYNEKDRENCESVCNASTPKRMHVLIVDDNFHLRGNMAAFLERHGITADTAGEGQEGLDKYLATPNEYDAIFMDMQMPVMNGCEAAKRIRESCVGATRIPIIAITGSGLSDEDDWFDILLEKPFQLEHLISTIERARAKVSFSM